MGLFVRTRHTAKDERSNENIAEAEAEAEAVSPLSASMSSPLHSSLCIHVVLELEQLVDVSRCRSAMEKAVCLIPCFSCIMKEDEKGVMRWVKTKVDVEKHMFFPEFPMKEESMDETVDEYISKMPSMQFDQSRPLWEVHVLNCRTSRAESITVFKCHHSLGDGISLMSSLSSIFTCADDPSRPPAFPRLTSIPSSLQKSEVTPFASRMKQIFLAVMDTVQEVANFVTRIRGRMGDTRFPTNEHVQGTELNPAKHSYLSLPLQQIKAIKNLMGGTVNDVLSGIIFYGYQCYLQIHLSAELGCLDLEDAYNRRSELPPLSSLTARRGHTRVTALTLVNTRVVHGLQKSTEMVDLQALSPRGNSFSILQTQIPVGKMASPKDAVRRAKAMLDIKKKSLGLYFNSKILGFLSKLFGPKIIGECLYNVFSQASLSVSNVVGPMDKICIAGHPVKRFSFFVSGIPQALHVHILSYMDDITIDVAAHRPHVDAHIFTKCLEDAFVSLFKMTTSS